MIVIGLISGTATDGIDATIVEIEGKPPRLNWRFIYTVTVPHPKQLRNDILLLTQKKAVMVSQVSILNAALGEQFARVAMVALSEAGLKVKDAALIGSHGQTIWHDPESDPPNTMQIGEPTIIAERTGLPVVSNFRSRDIAAGGQGTSLMAYVDSILFTHKEKIVAIQNIGGTGSVTFLPPSGLDMNPIGFDTGPGNVLIDAAATRATNGKWLYDKDGYLASRGKVNEILLKELLSPPYFNKHPPKSTGRELFDNTFAENVWNRALKLGLHPKDMVSTLTALTAHSIAGAYKKFLPNFPNEVIVSGGGTYNPVLMSMLADQLSPAKVITSDVVGIPVTAKKAFAFAILAYESWHNRTNNLPQATGARHRVILGNITPA